MTLPITPSQTIGPFSHEAWRWASAAAAAAAPSITISGIIRDGDGAPITDAQVEAWSPAAAAADQANALPGFRRVPSDDAGAFSLSLPRAGAQGAGEPATLITVFARGLVLHQFSAVFLDDDTGLADSHMLQQVPSERHATLIARKTAPDAYAWDIWMQGTLETVFFDYAGAP
ncbi:MAG: protocatechuate 3,4-dioxygenase [Pseudomonadota bacterium]